MRSFRVRYFCAQFATRCLRLVASILPDRRRFSDRWRESVYIGAEYSRDPSLKPRPRRIIESSRHDKLRKCRLFGPFHRLSRTFIFPSARFIAATSLRISRWYLVTRSHARSRPRAAPHRSREGELHSAAVGREPVLETWQHSRYSLIDTCSDQSLVIEFHSSVSSLPSRSMNLEIGAGGPAEESPFREKRRSFCSHEKRSRYFSY